MADAIVLKDEVEQLPSGHWIRRTWTRDARTGFMRAIVRLASAEEVREIGAMQAAGGKSTATASEITEVKCPHCGETLYRLGPLAPEVLGVLPGGASPPR